jgi:uncharacterized membrane protein
VRGLDRLRRGVRAEPGLATMVAVASGVYAVYSIVRFDHLGAGGFDLGIFDQVVWHYSHFQAPASSVKGLSSIWGDHFSPILVVLAPLYWVWDDARMLLLAQALLLALAAVPIFMYVRDRLGRGCAYLFAASYLVFWGVQSGVAFDFHELAFAPLIDAVVIVAVYRREWRLYAVGVLAMLTVKEDQSLLVVFLGIYLLSIGERRRGVATAAAGLAWYLLVVKLLIPHENPSHTYTYWTYREFGSGLFPAAGKLFTHPWLLVSTIFSTSTKTHTLVWLFVPFLGLSLCSRLGILLVPLLAERLLSTNPIYWTTSDQYTLALAAVLVLAAASGLANVVRLAPETAGHRAAVTAAAAIFALNIAFAAGFPLQHIFTRAFYRTPAAVTAADRVLARVPAGVSVAAEDVLIPRLTHRGAAAEISPNTGPTDYVIANVLGPFGDVTINGGYGEISRFIDADLTSYAPVAYRDGWLLLRNDHLRPVDRAAVLHPMTRSQSHPFAASYLDWGRALTDYSRTLVGCLATHTHKERCLRTAGSHFRASASRFVSRLRMLAPALSSDCRELANTAALAASTLDNDLDGVRRAALAGPTGRIALTRSGAAFEAEIGNDEGGYVVRFADLCESSGPQRATAAG